MIRLRGHHLLCLQTYKGLGYTPAFVAGMDKAAARLVAGEPATIVAGADDLCAGWAGEPGNHCASPSAATRDAAALSDLAAHWGRALAPGDILENAGALIAAARAAFAQGRIRTACAGCPWRETCDAIAASGFEGTRLP